MLANSQNLNPVAAKKLMGEIRKIVADRPEGLTLVVNEKDISDIQCDIEGPVGTPYEGGVFRCKLVIGTEFPAAPPRGVFLTKIFHPNVSPGGEICVNTLKKDWNPELGLVHILQVIRCLLIVPFPESALNEEASRLFIESYEEYVRRAALYTSIHAKPPAAKAKSGGGGATALLHTESFSSADDKESDQEGAASSVPSRLTNLISKQSSSSSITSQSEDESSNNSAKIAKTMPQKKSSRSALKRL